LPPWSHDSPDQHPGSQQEPLIFGSALASALYQILSRKLAAHDAAETSITYIALAGFLITTVPLPFVWQTPASGFDCLVFLGSPHRLLKTAR
jgi:drug/metabolite transporter (DMT)-like permease